MPEFVSSIASVTCVTVVCRMLFVLLSTLLNVLLLCLMCRDVEDSLDSLLEDAGLEGTGSEDGANDLLYYTKYCLVFCFVFWLTLFT